MADEKQESDPVAFGTADKEWTTKDGVLAVPTRPMGLHTVRFRPQGENVTLIDVDPEDGTETFFIDERNFGCPGCQRETPHDFYLEITAKAIATMTPVCICRLCEHSRTGKVQTLQPNEKTGTVQTIPGSS